MNRNDDLYLADSSKSVAQFAADFEAVCKKYDFTVNNTDTMDMAKTFSAHGADVTADFDLHMIQVCKPSKASKSLSGNPERSILMPKFVMAFSKDGKTQIRYMSYSAADISEMIDDEVFPAALAETFAKIRSMIDEAK
ncbi:MAG: DUF302 domain-containing protein [Desulfobulbaceae bacterium]|uniref:DUF302 domain-containing protein n=1 Tax=Candidatus Desulfatifera sulfidica TaxID=2841691 RepID=A0A8J6T8Y6_9BACT|nr:DUF302 domain-containing protein [Candidatus Desulfatifera sulfidica]